MSADRPVNPAVVRAYDLRGRIGDQLTAADGWALGLRVAARATGPVMVGYDGRPSSPELEAALVDGLVAGGAVVERVGLGPIGLLYHAVDGRGNGDGVMVTGSHNPADQNGFKVVLGGEPVFGDALIALAGSAATESGGGRATEVALADDYCARLLAVAGDAPPLRVAWDAGNGATGAIVERLAAALPGEHRLLHTAIDGRFPAHHPDPSVSANLADLQAAVVANGCDLGIAFDGDGDRVGAVDGDGTIVWPDQLMLLLARDVLRDHPRAAIVADVKSSRVLFDGIAAAGGRAIMAPSGYVRVRAAMRAAGAPFAGEMSGHLFFADRWNGTDDALHVAMRLLAALGRSGQSLAAFRRSLPATHTTPELRLDCPDALKPAVLGRLADGLDAATLDTTDGLRVTEPDGWWLVRASGTEPKLTARVEAWSGKGRDRMVEQLRRRLAAAGLP